MKIYPRSSMVVKTVLVEMDFDKTAYNLIDNVVVNTSAIKEYVF